MMTVSFFSQLIIDLKTQTHTHTLYTIHTSYFKCFKTVKKKSSWQLIVHTTTTTNDHHHHHCNIRQSQAKKKKQNDDNCRITYSCYFHSRNFFLQI